MTIYAIFLATEAPQIKNEAGSEEACACEVFDASFEDDIDPFTYIAVAIDSTEYPTVKTSAREIMQVEVNPENKMLWEKKYKPIYIKAREIWKKYDDTSSDYYYDLRDYEKLIKAYPELGGEDFSDCTDIDHAVEQLHEAMCGLQEIMEVIKSEYEFD